MKQVHGALAAFGFTLFLIGMAIVCGPPVSRATVTTTATYLDVSGPQSAATDIAFTFPYQLDDNIVVVLYDSGCTTAQTAWVRGSDYTLARNIVTGVGGTVTLISTVAADECLRIKRDVPDTQTTQFRAQSRFRPEDYEAALDKLTMMVQELDTEVTLGENLNLTTHESTDSHTRYAQLAGRSGGQTLYGGTVSGDDLRLVGSSAGSGATYIGSGDTYCLGDDLWVEGRIYGGDGAGDDLYIYSNSTTTGGTIYIYNKSSGGGSPNSGIMIDSDGITTINDLTANVLNVVAIDGVESLGLTDEVFFCQAGAAGTMNCGDSEFDLSGFTVDIGTAPVGVLTVSDNATFSDSVILDPGTITIPDSGDGNPATYAMAITADVVKLVTCSDVDTCDVTLSETSAISGQILKVINMGSNSVDFADSSGVQEVGAGGIALGQHDVANFLYATDRWVATGTKDN